MQNLELLIHTFITFCQTNSFLYQFFHNTLLIRSNLQKDFHQDNQSFVNLQFYKYNCLNMLAGNICFGKQVKNQ